MTLNQILDSIKTWDDHRNPQGESVINNYFSEGNCFLYDPEDFSIAKTNCLHVYLGIFNESIKVFLISADKDDADHYDSAEGILPYITTCALKSSILDSGNLGDEIPTAEAILRIQNWENNHTTWLAAQSQTVDNIFQAFTIPSSDIANGHKLRIYFGLKTNPNGGNDIADLLVFDQDENGKLKAISRFFDMARPVPPFSSHGELKESNFYLLEKAL